MKKQFLEMQPNGTIHLGLPVGVIAGKTPITRPEDITFITATPTSPSNQLLIEGGLLNLEGMIEIQKALQELRESMESRDPRNKSNWLRWALKRYHSLQKWLVASIAYYY